ncbi:MAG: hypothetical protein COB85_09685 [Bacteroidetes bacterium]|nr:MAG: hypothetical protein COB85_09685 [Bacteroidota bacterium]
MDTTKYLSGFNVGYALESFLTEGKDIELIKALDSMCERNKNDDYCAGIADGKEQSRLEKKLAKAKEQERDKELDEIMDKKKEKGKEKKGRER